MDHPNVEGGEGGPNHPVMEARVSRLEEDMRDVRATLSRLEPMIVRIDATMPHLARRSDLADLRTELKGDVSELRTEMVTEFGKVRVELASKASLAGVWTVGITLFGLTLAGMAAGAVYLPFLFRVMHLPPP